MPLPHGCLQQFLSNRRKFVFKEMLQCFSIQISFQKIINVPLKLNEEIHQLEVL